MDKSSEQFIAIEIACATPERQQLITCNVLKGTSLINAIKHSKILDFFPDLNLDELTFGIWSKVKTKDSILKSGDRIEIYRPLLIDPKAARRQRALKKKENSNKD